MRLEVKSFIALFMLLMVKVSIADTTLKVTKCAVDNSKVSKELITQYYKDESTGVWLILHGERICSSNNIINARDLSNNEILYGTYCLGNKLSFYYKSLGSWMSAGACNYKLDISSSVWDDPTFKGSFNLSLSNKQDENSISSFLKSISSSNEGNNNLLKITIKNEIFYINKKGQITSSETLLNNKTIKKCVYEHILDFNISNYKDSICTNTSSVKLRKIFIPLESLVKINAPSNIFGFIVTGDSKELLVKRVYINSPAWNSGLRPGMKVLQIAGIPVAEVQKTSDVIEKLKTLNDVEVIALSDDGKADVYNIKKTSITSLAVDNLLEADEVVK